MPAVFYIGKYAPVDVPLARAVDVQFGGRVDVADPAVAAGLLADEESWTLVDPNAPSKSPKAAPVADPSAPKE